MKLSLLKFLIVIVEQLALFHQLEHETHGKLGINEETK